MAVSFSLTPNEITKKAKDKGYKFLSDNLLSPTIKNGLPEKTFMLGDNNWNGSQPWMIKISKKNFTYINKKSPFYTSGINSVVKQDEATYTIPSNGKKNNQVKYEVKETSNNGKYRKILQEKEEKNLKIKKGIIEEIKQLTHSREIIKETFEKFYFR